MNKLLITGFVLTALVVACAPKEKNTESKAETHTQTETTMETEKSVSESESMETKSAAEEPTSDAEVQPMMHKVMFKSPANGAEVKSPLKVEMGVEGMDVKAAGEVVENTGHHHLIIDGEPIPAGQTVPADETHMHFGKGQTEVEISLIPGKHTLTLQFADGAHASYGPDMSSTVEITVVE